LVEANRSEAVIFVPDSSLTHAKKVKLKEFQLGDSFLIVSGQQLQGIDHVITDGARYLSNDASIKTTKNLDTSLTQK